MAVSQYYLPSLNNSPTRKFYVADTAAELTGTGGAEGELAYALDDNEMYASSASGTWVKRMSTATAVGTSQLAPTRNSAGNIAESNNNTTPANVTDSTVNLLASSKYTFRIIVFFTTAGGCGVKFTVGGTAGVSSLAANITIIDGTTNDIATAGIITAFDSVVGVALGNGTHYAAVDGAIQTSTAGTLLLKFCQNTSSASPATILVNTNISTFLLV